MAKDIDLGNDNTLRMDGTQLTRLHDELDAGGDEGNPAKRSFRRWPFRHTSVKMEVRQPGGAVTNLNYACRNLSSTGCSLMHSAYVHVGSPCVLQLPLTRGGLKAVDGKVARCRHVTGRIHEIGVQFLKVIELRDHMDLDPLDGRFAIENVDPAKLTGKLLHIESSTVDRRLLRFHLQDTVLGIVTAETGAIGLERSREGFDVIVVDFDVPDMKAAELLWTMRNEGVTCPIIVTAGENGPAARLAAREARANAFLPKPYSKDLVMRALGEIMLSPKDVARNADPNAKAKAEAAHSMAAECIAEIRSLATTLRDLAADATDERERCLREIRSAAKSLGFGAVVGAADAVRAAADPTKAIQHLVTVCLQVREMDIKMAA